jgi:carotenoid cleavage dioxygenase-like enzyme
MTSSVPSVAELSRRDVLRLSLGAGAALLTRAPRPASSEAGVPTEFAGTPRFERPPVFVKGFYEPVKQESTFTTLAVTGSIPSSLNGRYVRNGHNPPPELVKGFWFGGQGMLHGVRLRNGRAEWYRNRFVKTPALQGAPLVRKDGSVDLSASAAATSVFAHAGRIYALQEVNLPFIVTPSLDTRGVYDFGGKLRAPMTAHPKIDRSTGEMLFISNSPQPPYLSYFRVSPQGEITHTEAVEGPGPSVIHDFAVTTSHAVFIDPSVTLQEKSPLPFPYTWNDKYQAKVGIMPRDRSQGAAKFISVDPYYIFHLTNAWDDANGNIVFEATQYDRAAWNRSAKWINSLADHGPWVATGTRLTRWTIDPRKLEVSVKTLDELNADFPTFNQARLGKENRYTYLAAFPSGGASRHAIVKYDSHAGRAERHEFPEGQMPSEPWFVADPKGTGEDDGWLLSFVSDIRTHRSALCILDATAVARAPVAVIEIPGWIAAGVHGSWIDDKDIAEETAPA